MDLLEHLLIGFESAVTWTNLLYCLVGVSLGTLVGVLPGMGPVATVAMLLPITYSLDPSAALIMLAGIYYGAQYGGSTTAILVNIPGEASAVVTCLDGHRLALAGRAGAALGIASIGSFCAGCFATVLIAAFAEPLTLVAFEFGPREYFSLMVLGLVSAVVLASGSLLKAIGMILIGILLGCVGMDVNSGALRYVFGVDELMDGIDFVALSMGVYGFAEIIRNLELLVDREAVPAPVGRILPTRDDLRQSAGPIARGTVLGSLLGILPGGGALLSAFASYTLEKKLGGAGASPAFGEGNIRGVAGPESANNAGAQTSFIPMLTLGIPSNAVMALMIGALMLHDITPGPQVMSTNPPLFWGLIVSMWIGNVFLVILNIPLIGLWVRLLRVPYRLLYPAILVFCAIGVYSINNNPFDIWITIAFGVFGWIVNKLGCECAPLILGFIIGPMLEENMRRALLLSRGDLTTFVTGPVSGTLLALSAALLAVVILPAVRSGRERAFAED